MWVHQFDIIQLPVRLILALFELYRHKLIAITAFFLDFLKEIAEIMFILHDITLLGYL